MEQDNRPEPNEVAFWDAVKTEDVDAMVKACGGDPDEIITKFVASDIFLATWSRFSDNESGEERWTFAQAMEIIADPSEYDEACVAMGSWAEYVEQVAIERMEDLHLEDLHHLPMRFRTP
jgi:hypothetical protein